MAKHSASFDANSLPSIMEQFGTYAPRDPLPQFPLHQQNLSWHLLLTSPNSFLFLVPVHECGFSWWSCTRALLALTSSLLLRLDTNSWQDASHSFLLHQRLSPFFHLPFSLYLTSLIAPLSFTATLCTSDSSLSLHALLVLFQKKKWRKRSENLPRMALSICRFSLTQATDDILAWLRKQEEIWSSRYRR